jgi:hypothetical protein
MIEAVGHDYMPGYFGAFDEQFDFKTGQLDMFLACVCLISQQKIQKHPSMSI